MSLSLILASASPRRKQLLEAARIPFRQLTADTAEDFPSAMPVLEVPVFISANKARAVAKLAEPGMTILAADTIVTIDGEVLGKPADAAEAVRFLRQLSGRTHQVITGVSILHGNRITCFADTTDVVFHPLSDEQIRYYVDQYRPLDKAGAYAIQEWIGMVGIKAIHGDYYNVMGLPVSRVIQTLQQIDQQGVA